MRVKRCLGENQAALCLGCEAMIPHPFKSFLFLLHHQCPERCLLLLPDSQPIPPHIHPLPSSTEAQIHLAPLPLLVSSLQDSEPSLLLWHRGLCWQPPQSHPSCFHPSIPPEQHQNHEPGEDLGLTFLHPAQLWWQARLDRATEPQLSLGLEGGPCPCLLSGATHCPSHQWLPERKRLFPSRRSCIWSAQHILLQQTTIRKQKRKLRCQGFDLYSCQQTVNDMKSCILVFFPYMAFTEYFSWNQKTNMEKNLHTEACV